MIATLAARALAVILMASGIAGCKELSVEMAYDRRQAPYVPTPQKVVDRMLALAAPGPADVIYDLGSGDGRIPITAATRYNVRKGVGFDIDPKLIALSNENARKAGVADRVSFVQADIFKTSFSEASIVTLYLLPEMNQELRPRLLKDLKAGSRIVAHRFGLGSWEPDKAILADESVEKPANYSESERVHLFLWIVPAAVGGQWRMTAGGDSLRLRLTQDFQEVGGSIVGPGGEAAIRNGRLAGDRLTFEATQRLQGRDVPLRFEGRVNGPAMEGTLVMGDRPRPARAEFQP